MNFSIVILSYLHNFIISIALAKSELVGKALAMQSALLPQLQNALHQSSPGTS